MIKAIDYAVDFSMTKVFEDYVDSAFWSRSFSSDEAYHMMLDEAAENGIILEGLDEFDYDNFFYETYKDAERGLS